MKTHLVLPGIILSFFLSTTIIAQDAVALYNEGIALKNDKKSAAAIDKFNKAVALKPDYVDAIYELGWCQNDLKNYDAALTNLRKARTIWTMIPKVFFELGYAFEKTSQLDSAVQAYNRCLELKPDYSLAHKQLGFILYTKEDYPAALQRFNTYESLAKTEIKDYLYWYRKGFMLNAVKDYPNAAVALRQSLAYKNDYTNTYLELGFACSKQKQDEDAINYYKKAIDLDSNSHIPYNGIAEVYRDNKKDMNEAMAWYQKALAKKSFERKACFGMGYCLNSLGRYSEAITYLKKAVESEATYTAAYVELGYSHYMLLKFTEGIAYCDKAIELNPKNENARYYKGLIYISQKDKIKAQKIVDELNAMSSKLAATLKAKVDPL